MAKAKKKKRPEKYEDKLAINGSFEDVIKVSVQPQEKPKETPQKEKLNKHKKK